MGKIVFKKIPIHYLTVLLSVSDFHAFSRRTGGVDQIRLESYSRHSYKLDCSQSQINRHPQRSQYLEIARVQRAKKRHR